MKSVASLLLALPVGISLLAEQTGAADDPVAAYVATPHDVVSRMLALARLTKSDVVYDLGCGDGRIVALAARRYGCRGVGFDINPVRVQESRHTARMHNVEHLVKIEERNIFDADLRPASVVFLYLLPELNVKLLPQLEQLKPGSRVVSHLHDIAGVQPERTLRLLSREDNVEHVIYLWTVPFRKSKE